MTPAAHDSTPTAALIAAICARDPASLGAAIAATTGTPGAVDGRDARGLTPLLWAVREGWSEAVEGLLAAGADPNLGLRADYAPLPLSIRLGEHAIAARLMRSPGFDLAAQGYIAAVEAVINRDVQALQCLAEGGLDLRETAPPEAGEMGSLALATALLFNAVAMGLPHPAVFAYLLDQGADPAAAVAGRTLPTALCFPANEAPEALRVLLERDAPVDRRDDAGYAPLHHAAARDHQASARLLLDQTTIT